VVTGACGGLGRVFCRWRCGSSSRYRTAAVRARRRRPLCGEVYVCLLTRLGGRGRKLPFSRLGRKLSVSRLLARAQTSLLRPLHASLCHGRQLLASGAKVMATDFDAKQLADMQTASAALHVHAGDISKEQDVAALFERAREVRGVKLILTEGKYGLEGPRDLIQCCCKPGHGRVQRAHQQCRHPPRQGSGEEGQNNRQVHLFSTCRRTYALTESPQARVCAGCPRMSGTRSSRST